MRDKGPERGALGLPHQGRCVVAQIEVVHVALVHDGVQHRHRPAARIRRCDGGGGWQHLLCQSHPAAAGYNASRYPRPCLTSLGFRVTSSMYIEVKCCPLAGRGTPSVVISAHGMLLAIIAARSKAPDRLSSMKHASTGHTDIRVGHTPGHTLLQSARLQATLADCRGTITHVASLQNRIVWFFRGRVVVAQDWQTCSRE